MSKPTYEELENQIIELKKGLVESSKEQEEQYKMIFDSMSEMFQVIELIYDDKGKATDYYYQNVNPAFEKLVAKSRNQLIGMSAKTLFGVVENHWLELYDKVAKTGISNKYENYGEELDKYYELFAWKVAENKVAIIFNDITERKKGNFTLEQNQFYLSKAQEIGKMGHYSMDPITNDVEGSDILFKLFDVHPGQPIFEAFAKAVHPEDGDLIFPFIDKTIKEGIPYDVEHRVQHRDGTVLYLNAKGEIIETKQGRRLFGTVQDITERKLAEVELFRVRVNAEETEQAAKELHVLNSKLTLANEKAEKSEIKFKSIFDIIEIGITITDEQGNIVDCNRNSEKILGITKQEHLERNYAGNEWKIIRPDYTPMPTEEFASVIALNENRAVSTVLMGIEKANHEVSWISVSATPLNIDGYGVVITYVDISELISAKEKAEESEAKFRQLFDKVADAIFTFNPDTFEIIDANISTSKIYGYDRSELIGMSCLKFSANAEKSKLATEYMNQKGSVSVDVRHHKRKDGTDVFVNLKAYKIIVNEKTMMFSVCQDITESLKTNTQLFEAKEKAEESNRLKSAFLANISHEIRTPMNGILGFSELLGRKNVSSEKKEKYLGLIEKEGNRLLTFISDIVDVSKIQSNVVTVNTSSCNVNTLIDDLYSKYSIKLSNTGIKLQPKKGLGDIESIVKTDANKLVQILSNLIENAIKFTNEGVVEFGYSLSNNDLKFYVKDSGVGIEIEERENIFDRFTQGKLEQTHNQGSGLGLSIVKGLVKILGGEVWIDSEIGVGSTFFFTIPYENLVAETKVVLDKSETTLGSNHFTVLIVEDEHLIFIFLEEVFSEFDCTVLHADNGEKAIKLIEQDSSIDIVLMDINMPVMNGFEALEAIRKLNIEIPIIAQSGLAMLDDKEKMLKAGFDDYVSKPISRNHITSMINNHLNKTGSNKI